MVEERKSRKARLVIQFFIVIVFPVLVFVFFVFASLVFLVFTCLVFFFFVFRYESRLMRSSSSFLVLFFLGVLAFGFVTFFGSVMFSPKSKSTTLIQTSSPFKSAPEIIG